MDIYAKHMSHIPFYDRVHIVKQLQVLSHEHSIQMSNLLRAG